MNAYKEQAHSTGPLTETCDLTMAKKASRKPAARTRAATSAPSRPRRAHAPAPDATGKHLVIVESPTKAKTINKYLGSDYVVMASVGHVRDLPARNPKGVKDPVPGVDLDHDFAPTYEVMPDKKKTVGDLKKAAKNAQDVWFATDLDREGEAIAWHLAEALDYPTDRARRVVFNAITKAEIEHAFANPRPIDDNRVNAQQARRILDRIVGYQVSPLLWKKVAGGLSAGRVQSVAVRLVVEREREIEAFIPDEFWKITALLAADPRQADTIAAAWRNWLQAADDGAARTIKEQNAFLTDHQCLRAELIEIAGQPFKADNRDHALKAAQTLGFTVDRTNETTDEKAKGPARSLCQYQGHVASDGPEFRIDSIATKRTTTRPSAPFITSTMQQAAANRLGFQLQRTMRLAQQLYEGVDLGGARGQTGLITYMRTDSTHVSGEALEMARSYIAEKFGAAYLPDKPNFFSSSNKSAQEAHEAIRPTDVSITPQSVRSSLSDDQFKLYKLIWERFVSCQMKPAEWDSTTVLIHALPRGKQAASPLAVFKATGRTLVFDGFYKVAGLSNGGDDLILPPLTEKQPLGPIDIQPTQHFSSPPPRYTEASLQKKLEEEGIGRPSTYAAIIQTIQDRKYVEPVAPRDRRLMASDLGKVVTDMLVEAFPTVMDVSYTRYMEDELDKIEADHHDWRKMLADFYGPFKNSLQQAHENLQHAKAATEPAPHLCPKCGSPTVYRFGKNGRFLSCATYPQCDFAAPIDREGNPLQPELTDILCPECGSGMTKRTGRFGPFLGCVNYPQCKGIVKLDPKKHTVVLPKTPPLTTDLPCPKCESPLYLRTSKRGFWLSCSAFPKCRGRVAWSAVDEKKQAELEAAWNEHEKANPQPRIKTATGHVIAEDEQYLPKIQGDDSSDSQTNSADLPNSDAA
jgi:DNA topoisomerase-1